MGALFPEASDTGPPAAPGTRLGTGVLPYQALLAMIRAREVTAVPEIDAAQVQPASIDLRLGRYAYRVRASFLPGPNATVMEKVKQMGGHPLDLTTSPVLEKGCVYVIELLERVRLSSALTGLANPKSSTGRLDVLTRLITDYGTVFDQISPRYEGPLYVEVVPQTFSIVVRQGWRPSSLRTSCPSS